MKHYVTIERNQGKIIQDNYCCAWCWNRVIVCHDKDGDYLDCGTEGCRCDGLVTSKWVERQLQNDRQQALIARRILQNSLEWLKLKSSKPRSREYILKELGF